MTPKGLKLFSIIITAVISLLAVGNIIYAAQQVIPRPLFAAINDEICYREDNNEKLSVTYITNNADSRRIESITFDGLDMPQTVYQDRVGFEDHTYNDSIGRYYTLKRGYIELNITDIDIKKLKENGSLTLETGTAVMSDGSKLQINIGHIIIYTDERWNQQKLIEGAEGDQNSLTLDYKTEIPIKITSLDLQSFESHKDALKLTITVDSSNIYTYKELSQLSEPIEVNSGFQVRYTGKDPDTSNDWRLNMISLDMTYEKDGQYYDTWLISPFYENRMSNSDVEAYVNLWRAEHE